jgi:ribosomal protein L7/L12
MSINEQLPPEAVAALRKGLKINAIKIVRETWGLGLKESKDAVEAYARAHPEIAGPVLSKQENMRAKLSWLIRLVLLSLLGYLLYKRLRG